MVEGEGQAKVMEKVEEREGGRKREANYIVRNVMVSGFVTAGK
jgi:hypothetical protein